nr:FHA domain-containing protein [Anaerolineae bacterium]
MQPGARFRLVVRRGPQPNQQHELNRDTITIGRDITNDIVVNDPEVSRHHARLVRTSAGFEIEDLRSTNGTFINRHRVTTPQPLSNGDLIGLGETVTLAYEVVSGKAEPTVVAGGAGSPYAQQPIPQPAPQVPPPPGGMPYPPQQQPVYAAPIQDSGGERNRWIIIGCAGLTLIFCCVLVAAAIIIDQQNLYCDIPIMQNIEFFCVP